MKNVTKRWIAALLALTMCLSFAGCYDVNKTWAAQKGEDKLPIGAYIYYLYSAYTEAAGKVPAETEVLKATIEDKAAEAWIRDRATSYLKSYYWVNDKFAALDLTLSEADTKAAESSTANMWEYVKTSLEPLGVAQSSFHVAFSLYQLKTQKLLEVMYGEEGEMALATDELKDYFTENYYSYEYFYGSLSKTAEDGNSVSLTDEEKADVKTDLETYVKDIEKKTLTVEEAATEYADENETTSTFSASVSKATNLNGDIADALKELKDNEVSFVETSTMYYVVRKLPVADKYSEQVAEADGMLNLLLEYKGEEFTDFVHEQATGVDGVTLNDAALQSVKLSSMVTDTNKKGTSSASSDASASSTSSAS